MPSNDEININDETPNVIVGYSPTDFFYVDATNYGISITDGSCASLKIYDSAWDTSCNSINFTDNSDKCIQKEFCINKAQAGILANTKNSHTGADEKYLDSKSVYNQTITTTYNLGIGIFGLIILILINRK